MLPVSVPTVHVSRLSRLWFSPRLPSTPPTLHLCTLLGFRLRRWKGWRIKITEHEWIALLWLQSARPPRRLLPIPAQRNLLSTGGLWWPWCPWVSFPIFPIASILLVGSRISQGFCRSVRPLPLNFPSPTCNITTSHTFYHLTFAESFSLFRYLDLSRMNL